MGIDLTLKEHQKVEAVSDVKLVLFGMWAHGHQNLRPGAHMLLKAAATVKRISVAF